jgi:Cytochrome c554 and c-prime
MVKDDHEPVHGLAGAAPSRSRLTMGLAFALGAALLTGGALAPSLLSSKKQEPPLADSPAPKTVVAAQDFSSPERLFPGWPKPDVALVITGQLHGYLQPCGCSDPQLGGLARRYNFLKKLEKERGWNVVVADLGDVAQESNPLTLLKYKYAMLAFEKMGYLSTSIGKNELRQGLMTTLGEFALNKERPRILAANLENRKDDFKKMVAAGVVSAGSSPRIGLTAVVDPNFAKEFGDPDVKLSANYAKALEPICADLKRDGAEILVLFFEGDENQAKALAQKAPQFDVIVCLTEEEDANAKRPIVGNTMIVQVGQKGRYVGVVGFYKPARPGQPVEKRYQYVQINPDYETPKGHEADNPIHALLQDYAERVKKDNYLAKFTQNKTKHPVQVHLEQMGLPIAKYVGSNRCSKCHEHAYEVWSKSKHAHAYDSLVKAERPTLRQFDGECVSCHTTGGANGVYYETGFTSETQTPLLKNVGCESCHGPASEHVKAPNNMNIYRPMNPLKYRKFNDAADKMTKLDISCQACHDLPNSVHFKAETYWPQIEHMNPKDP